MKNKLHMTRFFAMSIASIGFLLGSGSLVNVSAQKDPFAKPFVKPVRKPSTTPVTSVKVDKPVKAMPSVPTAQSAPKVEDRIAYYKQLRQQAVINGTPIPKVTGFLTVDELLISGIFRTPRGVSAVVEAKPINLSYTVYPGEKFFDGQLVAVEDNSLVFRQVTKMSNGKFISTEVKRPLREFTIREEVQGTAPVDTGGRKDSIPTESIASKLEPAKPPTSSSMVSPLEEMLKQPAESATKEPIKKDKTKKSEAKKQPKKTVKVARVNLAQ
jgi:Tfp pilus assembly protein PilP